MTAALALLRRDFAVEVYEQADALKEVGAGIQVSANGMAVLEHIGIAEELLESAV